MLAPYYSKNLIEAGCDEAGRGCLAGPVCAAAVILPKDFYHPLLNDSKKISEKNRDILRPIIEKEAASFGVAFVSHEKIDEINILNASILAMHHALDQLINPPELILVDGNKFKPYNFIAHQCIVGGDGKYASIAAASILAKTYRDEYMREKHIQYPQYAWLQNKGYGTKLHVEAIRTHGFCPLHRKTFKVKL